MADCMLACWSRVFRLISAILPLSIESTYKMPMKVYISSIAHALSLTEVAFYDKAAIGVNSITGEIEFFEDLSKVDLDDSHATPTGDDIKDVLRHDNSLIVNYIQRKYSPIEINDWTDMLLIPGFVDAHAHAPQQEFAGTGMDLQLLQWLETYTFPTESKYKDLEYARRMYKLAVQSHLKHGTTTCSYFATIHTESCKVLVDVIREYGQRAYVGKVNMDRHSPAFYIEASADKSLDDTINFIEHTLGLKDETITPVLTPRFVPSCSTSLMNGLGKLSQKYDLPVQSHLSENEGEIAWVQELHPESETYAGVYEKAGLLGHGKAYMAHCCHSCQEERAVLARTKTGVVHCPTSNFNLVSGVLNIRKMLNEGIKVGLGTDVSGGYSASMLVAFRHALIASQVVSVADRSYAPLSWKEAFFLSTLGGAEVLSLSNIIGNFVPGKKFDALLIKTRDSKSAVNIYDHDKPIDQLQKFLFLGDDRNIAAIFVNGKKVVV